MFGCDASKSLTTFESFVSSAGETCHPFSVTVPDGAADAPAPDTLAWDPPVWIAATIAAIASNATTMSRLRIRPPPPP